MSASSSGWSTGSSATAGNLGAMENDRPPGPMPEAAWLAFLAVGLATVGGYALLGAELRASVKTSLRLRRAALRT